MKNLILIFTLLSLIIVEAQIVSLDVLAINGQSISDNIVSLGSGTNPVNIALFTNVSMPSVQSDLGTINIYYKKETNFPAIISNGGFGGNLMFLGSTSAQRSFNISLSPADFNMTGGFIYCEYTTFGGIKYKSENRAVTKTNLTIPIITTPVNCTTCQKVPYGGFAILPKLFTYEGNIINWYVLNNSYTSSNDMIFDVSTPIEKSYTLYIKTIYPDGSSVISNNKYYIFSESINSCSNLNYVSGYNNNISYNNLANKYIFLSNGSIGQNLVGDQALLFCPPTPSTPRYNVLLNNYQWQKRLIGITPHDGSGSFFANWFVNHDWINIPGANQINFSPGVITEAFEYRRLAKASLTSGATSSNIITIVPQVEDIIATNPKHANEGLLNNNICCSQITTAGANLAITLNALSITPSQGSTIQYTLWQISNNNLDWRTIDNNYGLHNSYTPTRPSSSYRGSTSVSANTFYYRRILVTNDNLFKNSNSISIYFKRPGQLRQNSNLLIEDLKKITIYPNPIDQIMNIYSSNDLINYNIKIIDLTGKIVLDNKYIKSQLQFGNKVDISNLSQGIFSIIFENTLTDEKIIEKIIKK